MHSPCPATGRLARAFLFFRLERLARCALSTPDEGERENQVDRRGKSQQQRDLERLVERALEIQKTQDRLVHELQESIEATNEVLKEIEERGRS